MDFREFSLDAARKAGSILKEHYGRVREMRTKGNFHELVTEADLKSNGLLLEMIKKEYPSHNIVSEEMGKEKGSSEYTWCIDPLDGTTNYMLHVPVFCVALGLVKKGEIILGVVYNPVTEELFSAERGRGSFLNGKRIHVSDNGKLENTVVNYCHPNTPEETRKVERFFFDFKTKSRDLRRLGSGGLDFAYLACGRNEAYIQTSTRVNPWDFVPGIIIAREAGARVTDWGNMPWTMESENLLATNGKIHETILEIIR